MPSDKLEGSSVMNSVVGKLFVDCFYGVIVRFSEHGVCVAMSIYGPFNLV